MPLRRDGHRRKGARAPSPKARGREPRPTKGRPISTLTVTLDPTTRDLLDSDTLEQWRTVTQTAVLAHLTGQDSDAAYRSAEVAIRDLPIPADARKRLIAAMSVLCCWATDAPQDDQQAFFDVEMAAYDLTRDDWDPELR